MCGENAYPNYPYWSQSQININKHWFNQGGAAVPKCTFFYTFWNYYPPPSPSSRLHESLHIAGMGTKIEYIPQWIVAHISPLHVTKTPTVTYISTMLSDKYTLPIAWEVNEDLLSTFKCHDCPAMFHSITTHLTAPCGHPSSTPCVSGHGYHDDDQNSNIPQVVFAHRCQLEDGGIGKFRNPSSWHHPGYSGWCMCIIWLSIGYLGLNRSWYTFETDQAVLWHPKDQKKTVVTWHYSLIWAWFGTHDR